MVVSCALSLTDMCITGELIRALHPSRYEFALNAIFSRADLDVLYATTLLGTVRLSLADGSMAEFSSYSGGDQLSQGDTMLLNGDGTVLYVGYRSNYCIVAYDVATLQPMWRAGFGSRVFSIGFQDELVFAVPENAPVTVLNALDGSVVRTLGHVGDYVNGISVFAGLCSFDRS